MTCSFIRLLSLKKYSISILFFSGLLVSFPALASTTDISTKSFSKQVEMANEAKISKELLLLITQDALEDRLESQQASCLLAKLIAAQREGLPLNVFEEKVIEGRAKGVSASRICSAVNAMLVEMQFSKQLLHELTGKAPDKSIIKNMVEVSAQGISRAQQTAFVTAYASRSLKSIVEGLKLYALLKQAGVSFNELQGFMRLVMKDDATLMRWKEVTQLFSIVIATGVDPDDFITKASSAVEAGILPNAFARNFALQPRSLGVTERNSEIN
ncbi:hypothetical protein [Halodesulfovibrio sp.]|uniref:hypothetical protein n=1 Tax=Halodesulfovibrio sp. TaxID=1912772 RepID=UPI0025C4BBA1|nr:hypothetical protein [Halodesulfovibrio sp.]